MQLRSYQLQEDPRRRSLPARQLIRLGSLASRSARFFIQKPRSAALVRCWPQAWAPTAAQSTWGREPGGRALTAGALAGSPIEPPPNCAAALDEPTRVRAGPPIR